MINVHSCRLVCACRVSSHLSPAIKRLFALVVLGAAISLLSAGDLPAQSMPRSMPGMGGGPSERTFRQSLMEQGGVQYRANTGQVIADVRITGNRTVNEAKIWSHIRTRTGREFDPEVLEGDVRRLTTVAKLFRNVRTYTEQTNEGLVVTFEVFERPTIRHIYFLGNREMKDKVLLKETGLAVGDALNQYGVQEARRKLEEFYRSKGYSKAEVSIREGNEPTDEGVTFDIAEGTIERVWTVNFIGNRIASDSRLKTQIQSKPGYFKYFIHGKVEQKKIDEDVERLTGYYRSLGFFRAKVGRELEYDSSGKWLTLTFVIDEGPRYVVRNVSVAGNTVFSNNDLLNRATLKSGDFFNLDSMNRDVSEIQDLYGGNGYIFSDIKADPRFLEEPGQLDLVYTIDEGKQFRVGNINVHIEGEFPHTRESVIINRLSLREGDIIDIREIRDSKRRLVSSQLFMHDPSRGVTPDIVVKPPSLDDPLLASGETTYRGQNPVVEITAEPIATPRQGTYPPQSVAPPQTSRDPSRTSSWMERVMGFGR